MNIYFLSNSVELSLHNHSVLFEEGKYYEMSSFGESKTMKWLEDPVSARSLVKYNSKQLSRYLYASFNVPDPH